jgi:hypothetical protein
MTRTFKGATLAAAIVAMLAVTGCGSTAQKTVQTTAGVTVQTTAGVTVQTTAGVTVQTTAGVTVTQNGQQVPDGGSVKIPDGFPADVPIYDPSTVTAALSLPSDKGTAFTVALKTADVPATVVAWYQTALKDKGWTVHTVANPDDGGGIITGEKAGQSLEIVVVAPGPGTDAKATMGISYSQK